MWVTRLVLALLLVAAVGGCSAHQMGGGGGLLSAVTGGDGKGTTSGRKKKHPGSGNSIASLMRLDADNVGGDGSHAAYSGKRWRHSHPTTRGDGSVSIELEPLPEERQTASSASTVLGLFGGSNGGGGDHGYEVQLASYASRDLARRGWRTLTRAAPSILRGLEHQIQQGRVDGTTVYRLRTGVMPDRGEAVGLCDRLRARDIECLVYARQ